MRIGELAAELGLNPKTIRYYEEIGLLPEPRRTPAGYRLYEAADRERLAFILKAREVGLSLDEISEIMAVRRGGAATVRARPRPARLQDRRDRPAAPRA